MNLYFLCSAGNFSFYEKVQHFRGIMTLNMVGPMVTLLFLKVPLYFKWKCTHRNMNSLKFECFEHTNVKICIRGICFCSRAKDLLWFTLVQWVSSVNGVLPHNGTLGQDIVLFSEFPFNFNDSVFFITFTQEVFLYEEF